MWLRVSGATGLWEVFGIVGGQEQLSVTGSVLTQSLTLQRSLSKLHGGVKHLVFPAGMRLRSAAVSPNFPLPGGPSV